MLASVILTSPTDLSGSWSRRPRLAHTPHAHLSRVLLAHEPRSRLLGQAALVQPQTLHVAVGGDALRLRGALHLLNLHFAECLETQPAWRGRNYGTPGAWVTTRPLLGLSPGPALISMPLVEVRRLRFLLAKSYAGRQLSFTHQLPSVSQGKFPQGRHFLPCPGLTGNRQILKHY